MIWYSGQSLEEAVESEHHGQGRGAKVADSIANGFDQQSVIHNAEFYNLTVTFKGELI